MSSSRGASSSRGRGKEKAKPPADSVAVAQMVATEVMDTRYVQIRKYTRDMAYFERGMGGVPTEQVVGGFAKSFRFVYTPGQSIAQGVMRIEHGYGRHEEYEVTIVILNPVEAQDGVGAQRIVDQTKKLADFPVIVEAHLSAYCENIKRWVVVYEKFDGYFYETVKEKENTDEKNENIAKFQLFKDKGKTELTDHWRITIRKFIEVLSFARVRNVFHGGLSRKGSYVVCSGVVKLIDVARRTVGQQPDYVTRDLKDLCKYFGDDTFLNATSSKEWISLDYLLKSDAMASDGWEDAALNHPILLSSATDKLTSYGAAEVFMWSSNTGAQRYEFSNVLYCLLGSDYRGKKINDFIKEDPNAAIYKAKLTGGNYNGPIYCDIIQYVRNIILHPPESWNDEFIAKDVAKLFPGLMSMAYSVAKVPRAEWKKLLKGRTDLPYKT